MMKLLIVGRLGKARGLRGEIYLTPYNADSPCWQAGATLRVVRGDADEVRDVIESKPERTITLLGVTRGAKGRYVAAFEEIRDRNVAEALSRALLAIPLDAVGPAAEDEFYFHEVPGWAVTDEDGARVGTVVRALHTHADLLEIRPVAGGETVIIPVVADFVREIVRDEQTIVVSQFDAFLP